MSTPPARLARFSAWLRARVDAWGVSDRRAAEKIGIGYSMLWNYLHGKQEPTRRSMQKLATAFGVLVTDIEALIDAGDVSPADELEAVIQRTVRATLDQIGHPTMALDDELTAALRAAGAFHPDLTPAARRRLADRLRALGDEARHSG